MNLKRGILRAQIAATVVGLPLACGAVAYSDVVLSDDQAVAFVVLALVAIWVVPHTAFWVWRGFAPGVPPNLNPPGADSSEGTKTLEADKGHIEPKAASMARGCATRLAISFSLLVLILAGSALLSAIGVDRDLVGLLYGGLSIVILCLGGVSAYRWMRRGSRQGVRDAVQDKSGG